MEKISIITRALKSSELKPLFSHLKQEHLHEVIAVCVKPDWVPHPPFRLIVEQSGRFEAKITGIKHARGDYVLLLDSDQFPEAGLISELEKSKTDMVIIPERSSRSDAIGIMLDDWRSRNERRAMKNPSPYIPVIPRFYNKDKILKAAEKIPREVIKTVVSHEDSVLYYEVFKITNSLSFSSKRIFNDDPDLGVILRKAFLYGKSEAEVKRKKLPDEYLKVISTVNRSSLNVQELGLGLGYIMQTLKALSYFISELTE
ncbi:MAG: hypothetical protein JRN10_06425 [Nitrososphaerota archaeon]|jgi:glycosyltransferase involved in cell wall biosynthesis|nr:hypothetical protein [Nitrososphaerota archaeon]MDG6930858.1 hypothetical protein [Nitrososphaerota archaeon]